MRHYIFGSQNNYWEIQFTLNWVSSSVCPRCTDGPINGEVHVSEGHGERKDRIHITHSLGSVPFVEYFISKFYGNFPIKGRGTNDDKDRNRDWETDWDRPAGGRDVNQSLNYDYYRSTKSLGNNVIVLIIIDSAIISCIASYCWWCAIFSPLLTDRRIL